MKKVNSMQDIALIAGVSEGTVSRALNDSPRVTQKTKEKILKIARENHFSANKNARNLSSQRSNSVAVVVNLDVNSDSVALQPFALELLGFLADDLAVQNMEMILSPSRSITGCWHNHFIRSKRADGIIILGPGSQESLFTDLTKAGSPFVVWGGKKQNQTHCAVTSNNRKGGLLATNHLQRDAKRKRIVLLGPRHSVEGELRFKGYCDSLVQHNTILQDALLVSCDWPIDSGFNAVDELVRANRVEFDAIFALSDTIAYGAIKALHQHGLSVPGDVAVVGYDDIPTSSLMSPALTSVRQDSRTVARLLVKHIVALVNNEKARSTTLDAELIIRESSS